MKSIKNLLLAAIALTMCLSCNQDQTESTEGDHGHDGYEHNMEGVEDNFPFVAPTHVKDGNKILDAFGVKFVLKTFKSKIWYIYTYQNDYTDLIVGYVFSDTQPPNVDGYEWKELKDEINSKQRIRTKIHRNSVVGKRRKIINHVMISPVQSNGNQYDIDDVWVYLFTDESKMSPQEYFMGGYGIQNESHTLHKGTIHFPGFDGGD